jgi:cephalosporin-C deacetylase-like acetyl esterase
LAKVGNKRAKPGPRTQEIVGRSRLGQSPDFAATISAAAATAGRRRLRRRQSGSQGDAPLFSESRATVLTLADSDLGAVVRPITPFPLRLRRALRGLRCAGVGAVAANATVFAAGIPGSLTPGQPDRISQTGESVRWNVESRDGVLPPPIDFDAFWRAKTHQLEQVPINPQLMERTSRRPGVRYWQVRLDNVAASHVHGQFARPATGDELPALLILQDAGVDGLQQDWVTSRAAEGWLTLNILAHDLPIDESPQFDTAEYASLLKDSGTVGDDDGGTSQRLLMYLSCLRALDYLQSRPDWDGRTLVVIGTGEGGPQALALAGLRPRVVSAVLARVPAASDTPETEGGRELGLRRRILQPAGKEAARKHEASRYYDPANFAHWIRCPALIGLARQGEELSPPSSMLAIANNLRSPKEILIVGDVGRPDHGAAELYNERRDRDWLPALRQRRRPPVGALDPAPVDRNWPTPMVSSGVR